MSTEDGIRIMISSNFLLLLSVILATMRIFPQTTHVTPLLASTCTRVSSTPQAYSLRRLSPKLLGLGTKLVVLKQLLRLNLHCSGLFRP